MLKRWLIHTCAVILASFVARALGLGFEVKLAVFADFLVLMAGVAVWGLLNATIGNILKLFSLPFIFITVGLFSLAINAFILILAGSLEWGFRFTGEGINKFITALIMGVTIAIINSILSAFFGDKDKKERDKD